MIKKRYDYIIVGSGTAGSLVANRISTKTDYSVLVIEAGGGDTNPWLKLPVGYFKSIYNKTVAHLYRTQADDNVAGRRVDAPRGRVVGGSSSINGLIFIRGQHQDFDDWEKLGATGWNFQAVLPHFRSFECYKGKPSQYRGGLGELSIQDLRNDNVLCNQWLKTVRNMGLPDNDDFNGAESYGMGSYQLTVRGHWRDSAATAFLRPALKCDNLSLSIKTTVTKIIIDGNTAIGLEVIRNGKTENIYADKEVILCSGTVQTPQILELSGIGDKNHLEKLGIPVVYHAPEVGENLQDHLQMRTIVEMNVKGSLNDDVRNPFKLVKMGWDWLVHQSGPLTVGAGQVGGALCTKYASGDRPDLQLFVMPLSVDKPGTPLHKYSGFTTSMWQCHPESRGSIHIGDTSPFSDPIIKANYLSQDKDCKVMVEGVKLIRQIYNRPEFKDLWSQELIPGKQYQTDTEILDAIRKHSGTVYHLVGTCRMGTDNNAVVNERLQVNGIDNLRIIDASVMPKITSANTNAPTCMIAEKGAAIVLEDG